MHGICWQRASCLGIVWLSLPVRQATTAVLFLFQTSAADGWVRARCPHAWRTGGVWRRSCHCRAICRSPIVTRHLPNWPAVQNSVLTALVRSWSGVLWSGVSGTGCLLPCRSEASGRALCSCQGASRPHSISNAVVTATLGTSTQEQRSCAVGMCIHNISRCRSVSIYYPGTRLRCTSIIHFMPCQHTKSQWVANVSCSLPACMHEYVCVCGLLPTCLLHCSTHIIPPHQKANLRSSLVRTKV